MRRTGLRLLGRSAWTILTWLSAVLCLVQMSACDERATPQPAPVGTKPAATQPAPVATRPATTQPVKTMTATRVPERSWEPALKVYWRAPDQEAVHWSDHGVERFTLLNATGHPHSSLNSGDNVNSELVFAAKPPRDMPFIMKNLERLRDMDFPDMTAHGTEVIDGEPLLRYELPGAISEWRKGSGFTTTIWVDPQTKRPVRFRESNSYTELHSSRGPGAIPPIIVEYKDIKFDEPLDDSLFLWPKLGKWVKQSIQIDPPADIPPKTLKITLDLPNSFETQLVITDADLKPVMYGSDRDLVLADEKKSWWMTTVGVGKRIRVTMNDLPAQELEVFGSISGLRIIYPP